MRIDLRERLATGAVLVADGATGTELQARGLPPGQPGERWCLENPDAVRDVASAYAAAGSDLVYTDSFGGNRWRLAHFGLADQLDEINRLAAMLAREGAGEDVYVVGSMGPTGDFVEPYGDLTVDSVSEGYGRQAAALVAGGADAVVLETFCSAAELAAAARGARATVDVPVWATLTYGSQGRTLMGETPAQAAAALLEAGVDLLGLNCGDDVEVVEPVLAAYRQAGVRLPLLAKPNAGMPVMRDGVAVWPIDPASFAERSRGWVAAGAQVIGGCCGTGPGFVAALAGMVAG
ncbi:MAG: homocysteine S-methyltransferase family protein [Armatimonadetes bacterium]|nr:homocysteine S-methyltransferase family protein [Armatimonadota bacterium]